MIRVKQQLKAYHKAQGLRGKRLKRAVLADVKLARRERLELKGRDVFTSGGMSRQFVWVDSTQGHAYWSARDVGL
jgi:hypothetical protein